VDDHTRPMVAISSLILASLLWGSSFVALKIAFSAYHPLQVIFGRMFIATLCLLIFYPSFRRLRWRKSDIKFLLIMALCEPCLYFLFEAKALQLTSASQAGMITAFFPLLVAILAGLILKEEIRKETMTGFFIAISGACWLSLSDELSSNAPNPLLGNLCEFLAMVCAAGYTVALKYLTSRFPPLFLTAFQALIGSLFFFPFLLLPDIGMPSQWQPLPAFSIIYLGTFVTLGGYGCFNFGVSRIPASQAAAYINLIPVFALVMGMLLMGDRLNPSQWLACAVVFTGVWLSSRKKSSPRLARKKISPSC